MKCSRCLHENPSALKFCGECGARLAAVCPSCGEVNAPEQKFCGECGGKLSPNTANAKLASPDSYTPKHLAEKILTSKGALEGERKQVTVLFADLKGSMELLAERDPEEARKILDPVLERMMEAVHHYEGTVNQVMGDGIMALFGAPLAQEDHAVRACYAALRMQQAIDAYAQVLRIEAALDVQIRVGINSGEVVVRSVGSDLRMDYSAVGQTTHLASRIEQLARPGSTLVTAHTLRLAEGFLQVRPLGKMPIKGIVEPVEVYELAGAGSARTRLQARATRGLTRFVGRQLEMQSLVDALRRVRGGHGEVVAMVGEPGVGKSRLLWEFLHSHHVQDWLVLESASVSHGKATAYAPVIDLLKGYFRIGQDDDGRTVREKVTGKLLNLDRQFDPLVSPLLSLLDAPVEDAQWDALDPPQRRGRLLEACKQLMLREAQVQPLVLVFEDLHWIDSETQSLLDGIVERLPSAHILLLVNYRPEYQNRWTTRSYYAQLRIDPLAQESAEELLEALLGRDASLAPLKRLLMERTARNSLFLEESVRGLVETGALQGGPGAYYLTGPFDVIEVPSTVQSIIAARIDRLAPEDKELLQISAVIGKDVPHNLLLAVADIPEDTLREGLARLQAGEFVFEASLFPDIEYTFKHALTHDVAYGTLLQDRRRKLHAAVLQALEHLYTGRVSERVDALGQHALHAERWTEAVAYLRQAGVKAFERSANREAANRFEQAVEALQRLPQTTDVIEQAVDLCLAMRPCVTPLADMKRLLTVATRAAQLNASLNDPRREALINGYRAAALVNLGRPHEAAPFAERGLAIAETLDDPALMLSARYFKSQIALRIGEAREALRWFSQDVQPSTEHLIELAAGVSAPDSMDAQSALTSRIFVVSEQTYTHMELGEFERAAQSAAKAQEIAQKTGLIYFRALAHTAFGEMYAMQGDANSAIRALEIALEIADGAGFANAFIHGAWALGKAYNQSGRAPDALQVTKRGWELAENGGFMYFGTLCLLYLAEAHGLTGNAAAAIATAEQALRTARSASYRAVEAHALRMRGYTLSQAADADLGDAERDYQEALGLASRLELRPLLADCHYGLARILRSRRAVPSALAHLQQALHLYTVMGMEYGQKQTEIALHELG